MYSCVWMQMHASSTARAWRRGQLGVSPYLLPCLETGFCVLLVFHPALLIQASWDSPASTSHLTVGLLYSHTWLFVFSENPNSDPCLQSRWFTHWTISPMSTPSGLETSLLKEKLVGMNSAKFSLSFLNYIMILIFREDASIGAVSMRKFQIKCKSIY